MLTIGSQSALQAFVVGTFQKCSHYRNSPITKGNYHTLRVQASVLIAEKRKRWISRQRMCKNYSARFPESGKIVSALPSITPDFFIGAIAFQKSRTDDINHDINAPTKIFMNAGLLFG